MHAFQQALLESWEKRFGWSIALLPISLGYGLALWIRQCLYAHGILRSEKLPATVITIGNVIVGGAGKTPVTIAVGQYLRSKGYRVGIVSRGYGRKKSDVTEVTPNSRPEDVGDEPLLIRLKTGLPVFVGAQRVAAGKALLTRYPDTQIILCDDGIQHSQLARDLEIYVFDDRGLGNGWLLPAGPMRTAWPPHAQCAGRARAAAPRILLSSRPGEDASMHPVRRSIADYGVDRDGHRIPLDALCQSPKASIAVAGIARPQRFFSMLTHEGIRLAATQAFPDHHDFSGWSPPSQETHWLLCTEKDAHKVWDRAPHALAIPLLTSMEPPFYQALDEQLSQIQPPPASVSSPV
ncbi:MAG: tetraacyldisaccharide 4'-kinase [Rhodoferax sp.]